MHAEFGIPVIDVAKSRLRTLPTLCRCGAEPPCVRCSSPPGCPASTRRTSCGVWLAGIGCPTRCAAPARHAQAGLPAATLTGHQPG